MKDENLRYSCQLSLPGFGVEGQKIFFGARVLIVGAGGIGCPVAQYLAAAGIGTIGIADYDVVHPTNLHRQILYGPNDIGLPKCQVACAKLSQQNPAVKAIPILLKIDSTNVMEIIAEFDIVVDATDDFDTKYLINDACFIARKPMVYGALYQFEGHVSVFNVPNQNGSYSPNYRDLYPSVNKFSIPGCSEGGVMPTVAGMIGCIQANEVMKLILHHAGLLQGKLLIVDGKSMATYTVDIGAETHSTIESLTPSPVIKNLTVQALKHFMENNDCTLIDVRDAAERKNYHLGGKHIPLPEIGERLSYADTIKPVVFYCMTGKRSDEAAKAAWKKFPGKIFYSLSGGLDAWKQFSTPTNRKI